MMTELAPLAVAAAEHGWKITADGEDIRVKRPGGGSYEISVYRDEDGTLVMTSMWCWDFEQGEYNMSDPQPFDAEAAIRYLSG